MLSLNDRDSIYRKLILPGFQSQMHEQVDPTLKLIGGQPGSGKSLLIPKVIEGDRRPVIINGDDLRGYHPEYNLFLEQDESSASDKTQADCNYWVERLIHDSMDSKSDVLVEGTMRNSEVVSRTLNLFESNGYSSEVYVLSVPRSVSEAGIFYRYELQKMIDGFGRFSPLATHDAALRGIKDTIHMLADRSDVRKFTLFNRPTRASSSTVYSGSYKVQDGHSTFLDLYSANTERPLTDSEREWVGSVWEEARIMAESRHADGDYWELFNERYHYYESEKLRERKEVRNEHTEVYRPESYSRV